MGVAHSEGAVAEKEHRYLHFLLELLIVQTGQDSMREGSHMIEVPELSGTFTRVEKGRE